MSRKNGGKFPPKKQPRNNNDRENLFPLSPQDLLDMTPTRLANDMKEFSGCFWLLKLDGNVVFRMETLARKIVSGAHYSNPDRRIRLRQLFLHLIWRMIQNHLKNVEKHVDSSIHLESKFLIEAHDTTRTLTNIKKFDMYLLSTIGIEGVYCTNNTKFLGVIRPWIEIMRITNIIVPHSEILKRLGGCGGYSIISSVLTTYANRYKKCFLTVPEFKNFVRSAEEVFVAFQEEYRLYPNSYIFNVMLEMYLNIGAAYRNVQLDGFREIVAHEMTIPEYCKMFKFRNNRYIGRFWRFAGKQVQTLVPKHFTEKDRKKKIAELNQLTRDSVYSKKKKGCSYHPDEYSYLHMLKMCLIIGGEQFHALFELILYRSILYVNFFVEKEYERRRFFKCYRECCEKLRFPFPNYLIGGFSAGDYGNKFVEWIVKPNREDYCKPFTFFSFSSSSSSSPSSPSSPSPSFMHPEANHHPRLHPQFGNQEPNGNGSNGHEDNEFDDNSNNRLLSMKNKHISKKKMKKMKKKKKKRMSGGSGNNGNGGSKKKGGSRSQHWRDIPGAEDFVHFGHGKHRIFDRKYFDFLESLNEEEEEMYKQEEEEDIPTRYTFKDLLNDYTFVRLFNDRLRECMEELQWSDARERAVLKRLLHNIEPWRKMDLYLRLYNIMNITSFGNDTLDRLNRFASYDPLKLNGRLDMFLENDWYLYWYGKDREPKKEPKRWWISRMADISLGREYAPRENEKEHSKKHEIYGRTPSRENMERLFPFLRGTSVTQHLPRFPRKKSILNKYRGLMPKRDLEATFPWIIPHEEMGWKTIYDVESGVDQQLWDGVDQRSCYEFNTVNDWEVFSLDHHWNEEEDVSIGETDEEEDKGIVLNVRTSDWEKFDSNFDEDDRGRFVFEYYVNLYQDDYLMGEERTSVWCDAFNAFPHENRDTQLRKNEEKERPIEILTNGGFCDMWKDRSEMQRANDLWVGVRREDDEEEGGLTAIQVEDPKKLKEAILKERKAAAAAAIEAETALSLEKLKMKNVKSQQQWFY